MPTISNIQITDRDLDFFIDHYNHEVLDTELLAAIHCHSEIHKQRLRRRIRKLRKAGLLKLLPSPIDEPNVSVITQRAMNLLVDQRGYAPRRISNPRSTKQYRRHDLALADFTVTFDLFVRSLAGAEMIDELQLVHRSPRLDVRSHRGWQVSFSHDGIRHEFWVKPDRFLGIQFNNRPTNKNARYFAIEVDRGSMPIQAASLEKASIERKLYAYQVTHDHKLLDEIFALPHAYTLFLAHSDRRRNNMVEAAQELVGSDRAARSILFATQPARPSVGCFELLTAMKWFNGLGEEVELPL